MHPVIVLCYRWGRWLRQSRLEIKAMLKQTYDAPTGGTRTSKCLGVYMSGESTLERKQRENEKSARVCISSTCTDVKNIEETFECSQTNRV